MVCPLTNGNSLDRAMTLAPDLAEVQLAHAQYRHYVELDYAGAALLVCRAAGRTGAGLVTLAVPESLQPLFAAKVVEATTMALPEDDVEEVDPEPALASVLDHEHDALVIGPGLRPSLAIGELLRLILTATEEGGGPPAVLDAARKEGEELLRGLGTAPRGLTQAEAETRARTTGPNEVAQERRQGWRQGAGCCR